MAHRFRIFITSTLVILTLVCIGARKSSSQENSWQRIAPLGESFTVLMPTRAVETSRRIPLNDKDSVPERVYYSLAGGKRYMVVSFVKTSPDRVLALSSFDNFMRGIEQSFKGGEKEISKSLTFDRELSFEGGLGRQYQVRLGEYPGTARFLGTDTAFYALMVIGAEENNADALRFLNSFAPGAPNSNNDSSGVIAATVLTAISPTAGPERSDDKSPPEPWPQRVAPISGGVLNGRAIRLAQPEYPAAARRNHESGRIEVQIIIDEFGNVIKAEASDGPPSLRKAAVAAAWASRFTPTRLMGQPVKVSGSIIYNFIAQ